MFYSEAKHIKTMCKDTVIYCKVKVVTGHQCQVIIHDRVYLNTFNYLKALSAIRKILKARIMALN